MKRKIIVGNWKMNPSNSEEARRIFRSIKRTAATLSSTDVVLCPPFTYISSLVSKRGVPVIKMGAQNVFYEEEGAFTGEVSAQMLKDLGVSYVVVGHSERREMGETNLVVAEKIQAIIEAGMQPILCVGEKEHDTQGLYMEDLKIQIKESLSKMPKKYIGELIVAYEPIWAIGGKEPMDPATIHETTLFVKKILADIFGHDNAIATPVLYGGAVNFRNAGDIISKGGVDGLLVGRESVNVPGFVELLKAVDNI